MHSKILFSHLVAAQILHASEERLLPGVKFDHANARDDLRYDGNATVDVLKNGAAVAGQFRGDDSRHGACEYYLFISLLFLVYFFYIFLRTCK